MGSSKKAIRRERRAFSAEFKAAASASSEPVEGSGTGEGDGGELEDAAPSGPVTPMKERSGQNDVIPLNSMPLKPMFPGSTDAMSST